MNYVIPFQISDEYLVDNNTDIEEVIGEKLEWLKANNIPARLEITRDEWTRVFDVFFLFEEEVSPKAQDQASLFKLFWT